MAEFENERKVYIIRPRASSICLYNFHLDIDSILDDILFNDDYFNAMVSLNSDLNIHFLTDQ